MGRVDAAAPAEWAEGRPPWRSASGGVGSSRRSSDNLADEGGVARAASLGRPGSSGAPAGACAVLSCCISWTCACCPCECHTHQWPNCWRSLQTTCVEIRRCFGGTGRAQLVLHSDDRPNRLREQMCEGLYEQGSSLTITEQTSLLGPQMARRPAGGGPAVQILRLAASIPAPAARPAAPPGQQCVSYQSVWLQGLRFNRLSPGLQASACSAGSIASNASGAAPPG